ncbi:plastocyanin/azurin family copper-binding protein [Saccharomonospora sp.]|uniref:cupredoxin domain-containing protein n=1 Tax=Saccharomonospora sp. TaxID=33913 RepID=UPI002612BD79|nr:plastocyanin/azurin family copper-binding protein [Saccharomonospora sp.]
MIRRLLSNVRIRPPKGARGVAVAGLCAALVSLWLVPAGASPGTGGSTSAQGQQPAQQQVLTWTADDRMDEYASAPTTAKPGPATIVFENSEDTGNTTGMSHTLTFDTSSPEYNNDVDLNIVASPFDSNGGRYEAEVTLSPGEYRYYCTIPGHGEMQGVLVVTEDGGDEDTTPPEVNAEVAGDQDEDGNYIGSATVTITAQDSGSGVDTIEYDLDDTGFQPYTEPLTINTPGDHTIQYQATDNAGNTSETGSTTLTVLEGDPEDTTPPEVNAQLTGSQDAQWNYVDSATVALSANDPDSGVRFLRYSLDGGSYTAYSEPIMVNEPGKHTVRYHATDHAGNRSDDGELTFTVVAAEGDACPGSDIRDTMVVNGHDSTVANVDTGNGCTINDLIAAHAEYRDHGAFLNHVTKVADDLLADNVISASEKRRMVRAAENSGIGE